MMSRNRRRIVKDHVCFKELRSVIYEDDYDHTPEDFIIFNEDKFPVLMRVTVGYCGQNAIDFTFASDEIYFVTHVLTQKRVILKDHFGQTLSFPADHFLKFHTIIDGIKSEEAMKLEEIILKDEVISSDKIELMPVANDDKVISFCVGPDATVSLKLGLMKFMVTYDERYIVGNSIVYEKVYNVPFIIPLWMPINVDKGIGLKDETEEDFKVLMKQIERDCKDFPNSTAPGNKEIMLFQEDIDDYEGVYDILIPSNSEYGCLPPRRDMAAKAVDTGPPPALEPRSTIHHKPVQKHRKPPKPPKKSDSKLKSLANKFHFGRATSKDSKDNNVRKDSVTDDYDPNKNEDVKANSGARPKVQVPHVVDETDNDENRKSFDIPYAKGKRSIQYRVTPVTHVEEPPIQSGSSDLYEYAKERDSTMDRNSDYEQWDLDKDSIPSQPESPRSRMAAVLSQPNLKPRPQAKLPQETSPNKKVNPATAVKPAKRQQTPEPKTTPANIDNRTGNPSAVVNSNAVTSPVWRQQIPELTQNKLQNCTQSGNIHNRTDTAANVSHPVGIQHIPKVNTQGSYTSNTSNVPKAAAAVNTVGRSLPIKPIAPQQGHINSTLATVVDSVVGRPPPPKPIAQQEATEERCEYVTYEQLPSSLKNLSVKQISDCLKLLKLDYMVEKFVEQDIDGELFMEMEKSDFEEFGFKKFEVTKLLKFKKGWRPNKNKE